MLGSIGSSKASVRLNSEHEIPVKSQQTIKYSGPDSAIVSIGGWVLREGSFETTVHYPPVRTALGSTRADFMKPGAQLQAS